MPSNGSDTESIVSSTSSDADSIGRRSNMHPEDHDDDGNGDEYKYAASVADDNTLIPESNVGYKLLQKLGWRPGNGLGAYGQGRVDPIPICGKVDMLGIGKGEEYIQVLAESTAKRRALMSEIISEETEEEKAKREAEITLKESIREQVKNMTQVFYCELCDKRYSSVPEWERHLSSYSHNHKKRFKDMRERTKHLNASGDGAGTHEKAMTREERELQRRKEAEEKELKRMLKLAEKHSSASQNKPSSGSSSTVADANSNANTDNSLGRDSNKQGVDIQTFETQGKAGWMSSGTMVSVQQKPSFGEPPGAPVVPMKSSGKESSIPAATHQTSPEGGRKPLTSTKLSFGLSSSSSSITGPKKLQPSKKFKLVFGKK